MLDHNPGLRRTERTFLVERHPEEDGASFDSSRISFCRLILEGALGLRLVLPNRERYQDFRQHVLPGLRSVPDDFGTEPVPGRHQPDRSQRQGPLP